MPAISRTVLVVDDCCDIREVLKLLLEFDEWTVSTAADIHEVSRHLDSHAPRFVLLDHRLAGSSALEVLDIIREKCPAAEIILMSAAADGEEQARRLNLKKFLSKPFDVAQFRDALR